MKPTLRIALAVVLLAAGVGIWWRFTEFDGFTRLRAAWLFCAVVLALIPMTRDGITGLFDRVRTPSAKARRWTAVLVAVLATIYLIGTGVAQGREFIPKFHDEHMHILQIQQLARGRLWMPQHELADFFETFHVFVKPVYASVYFPGTALMYVPLVWLGLPMWLGPAVASGAIVGLMYRVVTELLDDGLAGLLAAFMLLGLTLFRYLSLIVMSHTNMVLLALLLIWAYLHWRRSAGAAALRWAALIGALAGWAAITRPVDAICYVAPIGLAMLLDLRARPLKHWVATAACVIACAVPFLSLQIIENVGVTGHAFKTPYRLYADLYTPQMSFGFHQFDPTIRPKTDLPQRQIYYDLFTIPAAQEHTPDRIVDTWMNGRFPMMALVTVPNPALLVMLPLSVLALGGRRWVLGSVLPVYIAFYAVFAYLLPHYCVVVAPAVLFGVIAGKKAAESLVPGARGRAAVATFLTLALVGLGLTGFPEVNADMADEKYVAKTPSMTLSLIELPRRIKGSAVVLFRFSPAANVHEEPVYNTDVAWPDDARIVRAHDLGAARNVQLFRYYAQRQPERNVYLADRATGVVTFLGNVVDLAKASSSTAPTQPSNGPP